MTQYLKSIHLIYFDSSFFREIEYISQLNQKNLIHLHRYSTFSLIVKLDPGFQL